MPETLKNQYQYHTQANLNKLRKLDIPKSFTRLKKV